MDPLAKSLELIALYDLYQNLLTDKQRNYFEEYYFNDYSITEISENQTVSRNAVHDLLKRTIDKLYDYENKLHLLEVSKQRGELINNIKARTTDEQILQLLDELSKVE